MNLIQLYYFRTLAKYEHYSKSAEEIGISQSALSQSISSLERELGVNLFEKKGRNIALTGNGKTFLKYVEDALSAIDTGKEELKTARAIASGKVSLGVISGVAHFIPSLVSGFIRNHANVTFSCDFGSTDYLLKGLKEERYDIAICSKQEETNIKFVPIVEGQLVVLLPLGHHLSAQKEIFLKDIVSEPIIVHTHESGMRKVTEELFSRIGLTPQIVMEALDDMLIAKMVESNHGVAIITNLPEAQKCRIKIVPLADRDAHRYIYFAYINNRRLSNAARAFRSFVLEKQDIQQMFNASCNESPQGKIV